MSDDYITFDPWGETEEPEMDPLSMSNLADDFENLDTQEYEYTPPPPASSPSLAVENNEVVFVEEIQTPVVEITSDDEEEDPRKMEDKVVRPPMIMPNETMTQDGFYLINNEGENHDQTSTTSNMLEPHQIKQEIGISNAYNDPEVIRLSRIMRQGYDGEVQFLPNGITATATTIQRPEDVGEVTIDVETYDHALADVYQGFLAADQDDILRDVRWGSGQTPFAKYVDEGRGSEKWMAREAEKKAKSMSDSCASSMRKNQYSSAMPSTSGYNSTRHNNQRTNIDNIDLTQDYTPSKRNLNQNAAAKNGRKNTNNNNLVDLTQITNTPRMGNWNSAWNENNGSLMNSSSASIDLTQSSPNEVRHRKGAVQVKKEIKKEKTEGRSTQTASRDTPIKRKWTNDRLDDPPGTSYGSSQNRGAGTPIKRNNSRNGLIEPNQGNTGRFSKFSQPKVVTHTKTNFLEESSSDESD